MPSDTPIPAIVQPLIEAALKAAHVALLRRQQGVHAEVKIDDGYASLATRGDVQSEQIIRAELEKAKPQILKALGVGAATPIDFIMEESEHLNTASPIASRRAHGINIVVDPIDGTHGFSYPNHKQGANNQDLADPARDRAYAWCVSIGLEQDGKTIAAAVYEAGENEWRVDANKKPLAFDSDHPSGKIFWAEKNTPNAYRMQSPGGFTVIPAPANAYSEADGKPVLRDAPALAAQLAVDYGKSETTVLSKKTPVENNAPIGLGDYKPDRDLHNTEHGVVMRRIRAAIEDLGKREDRSFSAVSSCLQVADGRAAGFTHGCFFPWDDSAARLILEKSGAAYTQYRTPNSGGQMSIVNASRDPVIFRTLNDTLLEQSGVTGELIGSANTPNANIIASEPPRGIRIGRG